MAQNTTGERVGRTLLSALALFLILLLVLIQVRRGILRCEGKGFWVAQRFQRCDQRREIFGFRVSVRTGAVPEWTCSILSGADPGLPSLRLCSGQVLGYHPPPCGASGGLCERLGLRLSSPVLGAIDDGVTLTGRIFQLVSVHNGYSAPCVFDQTRLLKNPRCHRYTRPPRS
jgi:hypothetical protein